MAKPMIRLQYYRSKISTPSSTSWWSRFGFTPAEPNSGA